MHYKMLLMNGGTQVCVQLLVTSRSGLFEGKQSQNRERPVGTKQKGTGGGKEEVQTHAEQYIFTDLTTVEHTRCRSSLHF